MGKQYRLHAYDVRPAPGDEEDGAHRGIDQMVEDGWAVHTATVHYPEASILWERDAPEEENGGNGEAGPAAAGPAAKPAAHHRARRPAAGGGR